MNNLGLLLYLAISMYITVYVGKVLYTNGRPFLLQMLHEDAITDSVNRILLTGYYLVNLGYVCIMLIARQTTGTLTGLVGSLSDSIGRIVLTLGLMHFLNIAVVITWSKLNSKK